MTLKEYLEDYASAETKTAGEAAILREIERIPNEKARELCRLNIEKIVGGQRDFRF